MKTISKLIVFTALLATAPTAKAGQLDFDGITGRTAAFTETLAAIQAPEAAAPDKKSGEPRGQVLSVAVERNATAKKAFSADGAQTDLPSVKFIIKVKSPAADSEWAVGDTNKLYALGAARQAPEFAAVRKLTDALSLLGNPGLNRGKKCQTDTSYTCVNGQTNECKIDQCGWCGKWEDGTYGCEWETTSAPYGCRPNGYRC